MRGAGSRDDERHTSAAGGQLDAKQLSGRISHASGADELLRLFAAHSASLNHIHAANLWNKLGKQRIERRHEEQLEQLVQRTLDLVPSCRARELSNVSHGVARCGLQARAVHPLFVVLAKAAVRGGLAGFNPQSLANTVWAYATAGHYHQALLAACSRVISDSLPRFHRRGASSTASSFTNGSSGSLLSEEQTGCSISFPSHSASFVAVL